MLYGFHFCDALSLKSDFFQQRSVAFYDCCGQQFLQLLGRNLLRFVWLALQLVKTVRYWLAEAVQAVPVLYGWWKAPFVEIQATQYPESCWQAIAPAALAAILDCELDWACAAESLE